MAELDIKHLNYFKEIVDQNFNLTRAAEVLYISQPTLSIMINDFEKDREVKLFKRRGQKIIGLTNTGERYYNDALEVIEKYHDMLWNLNRDEEDISGRVVLGIPPVVLSVLFADVLPKLIESNPQVKFEIIEKGAQALKNDLLTEKIDVAILLMPHGIADFLVESYEIERSEMVVYVSNKNPLTKNKGLLDWKDLVKYRSAFFDNTFMMHHHVKAAFLRRGLDAKLFLTSISWDFLLNSVRLVDDLYTFLPKAMANAISNEGIEMLEMKEPVNWSVHVCRMKKTYYEPTEDHIFREILKQFEISID